MLKFKVVFVVINTILWVGIVKELLAIRSFVKKIRKLNNANVFGKFCKNFANFVQKGGSQ